MYAELFNHLQLYKKDTRHAIMKPTLHGYLVSIGVCSRSVVCSLALCYTFACMVVVILYTEVSLELGAHGMTKVVQLFLWSPFKFPQKAVNMCQP